jgi:uncharacterized membrane protein YjfL (UPF0719 family)
MTLDTAITAIIYIASCYFLFWVGKLIYDLLNRDFKVKEELVKKDNAALALALTGYYFGLILSIGGVIVGPSQGIIEDLIDVLIYGPLAIILMNISAFINDKLILYQFNNKKEIIQDQNMGTGVIELATYVATGMIIFGSISGEGGTVITTLIFWGLGQIVLITIGLVYNLITPYNIHEQIERDNVAVGISFAGAIVAMGNIIRVAVSGDFISWQENLSSFIGYCLLGIILLPIIRLVTDKVLLPGERLTDELVMQEHPNLGAAFIESFSYIGTSFLIVWCI